MESGVRWQHKWRRSVERVMSVRPLFTWELCVRVTSGRRTCVQGVEAQTEGDTVFHSATSLKEALKGVLQQVGN